MAVTYSPIATTTLGSNQTTVTFSSIPQTYTDLVVIVQAAANGNAPLVRYNNNSSGIYSGTYLRGDGSSAISFRLTNQTWINVAQNPAVNEQYNAIFHIQNYSNATTYKTTLFRGNAAQSTTVAGVALYQNTSAISRIDFVTPSGSDVYNSGSMFTLYGITAA